MSQIIEALRVGRGLFLSILGGLALLIPVVIISNLLEVDKQSFAYKKCLYDAAMTVERSAFNVQPNTETFMELMAISVKYISSDGDEKKQKECVAAIEDFTNTWNDNGGKLNSANWNYVVSTFANKPVEEKQSERSPNAVKREQKPTKKPVPEKSLQTSVSPDEEKKLGIDEICDPSGECPIGAIGPGGGLIFYDAGTRKTWGRYLEVSLSNSYSVFGWCGLENGQESFNIGTSLEVGSGYENTQKIKSRCLSGANIGDLATSIKEGKKTDWFIPSLNELIELKNSSVWEKVNSLASGSYLATSSQSENNPKYSWSLSGSSPVSVLGGGGLAVIVRRF
jgi:hypothetical protein